MLILAIVITVVILALACIHVMWAFEVWWPYRDEATLVAAVVGMRGVSRMPGAIPCGAVALGLSVAALLIWMPLGWPRNAGLALFAAVFAGRAIAAFVPVWRRIAPQQPFARNDRLLFAPLCAVLAVALWGLRGWTGA